MKGARAGRPLPVVRPGALAGLLALSLTLTGCWDRREIEERAMVLMLALDRAAPQAQADQQGQAGSTQGEGGGQAGGSAGGKPSTATVDGSPAAVPAVAKPSSPPPGGAGPRPGRQEQEPLISVMAQIAIPGGIPLGGLAAGGGAAGPTVEIRGSTGGTVATALSALQRHLNQTLFLGHTRVIAVSETLARQGLDGLLEALRRSVELRRLAWLVIVKDKAAEALVRFKPKLERVPMFYVNELLTTSVRDGRLSNLVLGEYFIRRANLGEDPVLPLLEVREDDIVLAGLAVFSEDRLVGFLNEHELWTQMQVRGVKAAGETVRVEVDGREMVAKVFGRSVRLIPQRRGGRPVMQIYLRLEANLVETGNPVSTGSARALNRVQTALEKRVRADVEHLVRKTQAMGADIFAFGEYYRAYRPRWWKEWRSDWHQVYKRLQPEVHVTVAIRRIGIERMW